MKKFYFYIISTVILVYFIGVAIREPNLLRISPLLKAVREIEQTISNPLPLRKHTEFRDAFLIVAGIVKFTNDERAPQSLPALAENATLAQIAKIRADDMFKQQYFAHESPDGKRAADHAEELNYEFAAIGENIALGDFENDEELVRAWMASPGHRANILGRTYTEIGAAAVKGTFEGRQTWIAVQIFAKPLADCPGPDAELKRSIDAERKLIDALTLEAEAMREELSASDPQTEAEREQYNKKVGEYNDLVKQINQKIERLREMIDKYNAEAREFNSCLHAN